MPETIPSLSDLASLLRKLAAPPSISDLITQIGLTQEYQEFVALVNQYVPEAAKDILNRPSLEQKVAAFAQAFSNRYFQLDDRVIEGDVEGYADITQVIPIVVYGISFDDYHEIAHDTRLGIQLMTYLVEDPYEIDQPNYRPPTVESGARMALYDSLFSTIPRDLLNRVPFGGLPLKDVEEIFANSRFKAIVLHAQMLNHCTGNCFLDTDWETLCQGNFPEWDPRTVEELKLEWLEAERIYDEIIDFCTWLEQDPVKHFKQVLYFMERGRYINEADPEYNAIQLELAL